MLKAAVIILFFSGAGLWGQKPSLNKIIFQDKDYEKAMTILRQKKKENPKNHKIYYYEGYIYFVKNNYLKALKMNSMAYHYVKDDLSVLLQFGRIYSALNELDKAREYLFKALKLSVKEHRVFYELGKVYYLEKKYNRAIYLLDKAILIKPRHAYSFYVLALCYFEKANLPIALTCVDNAILFTETNSDFFLLKGEILIRMKKPQKAAAALTKALELDPAKKGIKKRLAEIMKETASTPTMSPGQTSLTPLRTLPKKK